ncbi:MAG: XTP/dITP diphosphatase [Lachnospiraceae bacterium]|nr:XTP/dITP diphosphatase [Lachnospiraceae bacterium]
MRKIIFATGNKNKAKEIHEILKDLDFEIQTMKEAGIDIDIVEDGKTFSENSMIKAKSVYDALPENLKGRVYVMADDSGLSIDYLNGEPGIYSARYMGEDTSYDVKNKNLIERLEGVEKADRSARFVCAISCIFPDGTKKSVEGTIEGYIGWEMAGENGFGYDPIFYVDEYGCSTAQMTPEQKNAISHRGKALRAMREELKKNENISS